MLTLPSVRMSTTLAAIVLSPAAWVSVIVGPSAGVGDEGEDGVADGCGVALPGTESAAIPKSFPRIEHELQANDPPGTSTPLTLRSGDTMPAPKLAVEVTAPNVSSEVYAAREFGSLSVASPM